MQQKANTPNEIQNVKPRAVLGSEAPALVINNNRNEVMVSINRILGLIMALSIVYCLFQTIRNPVKVGIPNRVVDLNLCIAFIEPVSYCIDTEREHSL